MKLGIDVAREITAGRGAIGPNAVGYGVSVPARRRLGPSASAPTGGRSDCRSFYGSRVIRTKFSSREVHSFRTVSLVEPSPREVLFAVGPLAVIDASTLARLLRLSWVDYPDFVTKRDGLRVG